MTISTAGQRRLSAADEPLARRLVDVLPLVRSRLEDLVRIPSVSADEGRVGDVEQSAKECARLLTDAGLRARVVRAGGLPSVIARRSGPIGAPTVLLYAHHDVQPPGEPCDWHTAPFEPVEGGGRLYGRGAADDKAGVMVHVAALLAAGPDLPVAVTVLIDGEEEIGSPTLPDLLAAYRDDLAADVLVIADAVNWTVDIPSLTTTLRGLVDIVVEVRTLEHALHSGAFGGPVPDALTTLCALLGTLHDATGHVAVDGLAVDHREPSAQLDEAALRSDAGILPGTQLAGSGPLAARLWYQPAIAVVALDAPPVDGAANALRPAARAKISMRIAPGDDPDAALRALAEHLQTHVRHGAEVSVSRAASARAADIPLPPAVRDAALSSLRDGFGADPVEVGVGGTLPLVRLFTDAYPGLSVLVTGVEDPDTRAHGADESLHLASFGKACLAEALLLRRLAPTGARTARGIAGDSAPSPQCSQHIMTTR